MIYLKYNLDDYNFFLYINIKNNLNINKGIYRK